jgi:3D (Asp-Asp-Asp) domain-containing protein
MEKIVQRMRKGDLKHKVLLASLAMSISLSAVGYYNLTNTIKEERKRNVELKEENNNLKLKIKEQIKDINQKKKLIETYQGNIKELQNHNYKLQKHNYELQKHNYELQKTIDNQKVQIKNQESKIKELENKLKKTTSWQSFTMTHYTAYCDTGCIGITKTGYDVSDTIYYNGRRIIATDPRYIPLGSIVEINDNGRVFVAQALDTGGRIKGRRIDLLVHTDEIAFGEGVKEVKVRIIRKGWG